MLPPRFESPMDRRMDCILTTRYPAGHDSQVKSVGTGPSLLPSSVRRKVRHVLVHQRTNRTGVQCWPTPIPRISPAMKLTIDQKFWLAVSAFALVLITLLLTFEK